MKKLIFVVLIMCAVVSTSFGQKNGHYKTRATTKSSVIRATPATPAVPGVSPAVPATPASQARKQNATYYSNKKGHAYGHLKNKSKKR